MAPSKLILVIGATGAQGRAVINALLKPKEDGTPSPYTIRALTRDPKSTQAQELTTLGVECVEGSFEDFTSVEKAFEGVYGAWVNTDGGTVGQMRETHAGMRIFETARRSPSVRHYVWSSLDYGYKKGGYSLDYINAHHNSKARVADWMKAQPSIVSDSDLSWSVVTSGPYMEMLHLPMLGPLNKRADGTFVFASPVGEGHVPMIALEDLGWWARYAFDHREETSSRELEIASEMVSWESLVQTFTRVTGYPAVFRPQTMDEWFANFDNVDRPYAKTAKHGDGTITWRQNFSAFWSLYKDDIITRDMAWIRSVHPGGQTVESWMRGCHYNGGITGNVLNNHATGSRWSLNTERMANL